MNIVHVVLSGGWGGSEAIAFELCNELSQTEKVGVAVRATEHFPLEFYRQKLSSDVDLVDLADPSQELLPSFDFAPDILHAHLSPSTSRIRNIVGPKKVGHMHMRFYTPQFAQMDAVIAVAPWQFEDIPSLYSGKSFYVPNFMPHKEDNDAQFPNLRDTFDIPAAARIIGTTGRLNADKGFDVLIEAMRLVGDDFHCVIVGHGNKEAQLRRSAEGMSNIHFTGFEANILPIVSQFDLYVSSSRADSFGLSLLEAMHLGLPVVATKTFGGRHLLESAPERLVDMEDHIQLAKALSDPLLWKVDKETYNLSRFDAKASAEMLRSAYADVLAQ